MSRTGLNVIGLISGGKDSAYSLLHCIHNGHRLVALANLHPEMSQPGAAEEGDDDINSFMYQTVGHGLIPLYSEALGLPLYRQPISGGAIITSKDYDPNGAIGDETEDLVPLLQKVIANHPEANAVSSGAILSTYQRTRIESVALRLGLIPLAYLWQYPYLPSPPQRGKSLTGLLDDMEAAGCEARIIKTATGGLDEKVMWGDVCKSAVRQQILRGMSRYYAGGTHGLAAAVLGEGGEYETLALDGPERLWQRKIEVKETRFVQGDAGTVALKFGDAKCIGKAANGLEAAETRVPALYDNEFAKLIMPESSPNPTTSNEAVPRRLWTHFDLDRHELQHEHVSVSSNALFLSNICSPTAGSLGQQLSAVVTYITQKLASYDSSPDNISCATILLRSMSDFAHVNQVYGQLFTKPNPPARITVACGNCLPPHVDILMSFVVDLGPLDARRALHVQSRSYWAPANIGPYSQAICVPVSPMSTTYLVHVAGQIPLVPATMELLPEPKEVKRQEPGWFHSQAILSLQHLWRIGEATDVDWWANGIAFLAKGRSTPMTAVIAGKVWEAAHKRKPAYEVAEDEDDPEAPDAWDRKYGLHQHFSHEFDDAAPSLPNFTKLDLRPADTPLPPFLAVEVDSLPRDSAIEWQSLGLMATTFPIRLFQEDQLHHNYSVHYTELSDVRLVCIAISEQETPLSIGMFLDMALESSLAGSLVVHVTAYVPPGTLPLPPSLSKLRAQIVPCYSVRGPEGQELALAVMVRSQSTKGESPNIKDG